MVAQVDATAERTLTLLSIERNHSLGMRRTLYIRAQ